MTTERRTRILVVEKNGLWRSVISVALKDKYPYSEIFGAENTDEARRFISEEKPDLIGLMREDSLKFYPVAKKDFPDIPIVAMLQRENLIEQALAEIQAYLG